MFSNSVNIAKYLRRYEKIFDDDYYLNNYPDVDAEKIHPVVHFILHGEQENRNPSPLINISYVRSQIKNRHFPDSERPLAALLETNGIRPLPTIDLEFCRSEYQLKTNLEVLQALHGGRFAEKTISWMPYTSSRASSLDTEHHQLLNNLCSGLIVDDRTLIIRKSDLAEKYHFYTDFLDAFEWNDEHWIVARSSISESVLDQIKEQSKFEPVSLYPGPHSIPHLRIFRSIDLEKRDGLNASGIYKSLLSASDVVLVIDRLETGGASKYVIEIARHFAITKGWTCELLLTDQWAVDARSYLNSHSVILDPKITVYSLFEDFRHSWKKPQILTSYLLGKLPKVVLIANSATGYEALEKFAKTLRTSTQVFSLFFSECKPSLGVSYSSKYLSVALNAGNVLTDNQNYVESVSQRLIASDSTRIRVLRPLVGPPTTPRSGLAMRRVRRDAGWICKIIWYGRLEPLKDAGALFEFARNTRDVEIHVFGPNGLSAAYEIPKNVVMHGPVNNIAEIELVDFDVYLFTSKFEGFPNALLEVSQFDIPIICADVGGIRETFSDEEIFFYNVSESDRSTAGNMHDAFDNWRRSSDDKLAKMANRRRTQIQRNHSEEVFSEAFSRIFSGI